MTAAAETLVAMAKEVTGRIASGLAVMTLVDSDGVRRGMTISSLTPVSVDPPSVLMCIGGAASALPSLTVGQAFCANLLSGDQSPVSVGFAWGDDDPFEVFAWEPADDGTPVLEGIAAHLLCRVERLEEHHGTTVVLAEITGGGVQRDESLVYWRHQYFGELVPAAPPVTGAW